MHPYGVPTVSLGGPPARGPEVFELEVRPADELDSGWLGEDSIETGPPQRPWAWKAPPAPAWFERFRQYRRRQTALVIAAVAVALAVAVGISAGHPNRPLALAAPDDSTSDQQEVLDPSQQALADMVAAAESPIELTNYLISDNARSGCRAAQPPGRDPAPAIAAMVITYEPGFTLRDSGRGIEESGTCAVQLRFADPAGTTMMVTVSPPPNAITPLVALSVNDRTSAMDIIANVDGWRVEVGAVGLPGQLPTQSAMTSIATDARIRW
jgi:hypothetical protein